MSRTVRYASSWKLFGWPLLSIARGPDTAQQEDRGHAKGVVAFGDKATGVLAIGGIARGLVAIGGIGFGLITFAGVGLGGFAFAGVAISQTAFGGVAIGHYAQGGVAIGAHTITSERADHTAVVWFKRLGLHRSNDSRPAKVSEKNAED